LLGQSAAGRPSLPDFRLPAPAENDQVPTPADPSTSNPLTPRGQRVAFAGAGVAVLAAVVYVVWRVTVAAFGG
jgi:hypothetical protein